MMETDIPNWVKNFKEEMLDIIRTETGVVWRERNQTTYPNFRTVSGLPICFYCKRLGHVKKHCRKFSLNQLHLTEQERQQNIRDLDVVEQMNEGHGMDNAVNNAPIENEDDDFLVRIGKSFRSLQQVATELEEMITQTYRPNVREVELTSETTEFETSLIKGAMLDVLKTFHGINNFLDGTTAEKAPGRSPSQLNKYEVPFHDPRLHAPLDGQFRSSSSNVT